VEAAEKQLPGMIRRALQKNWSGAIPLHEDAGQGVAEQRSFKPV
jgi:hypothetical protein